MKKCFAMVLSLLLVFGGASFARAGGKGITIGIVQYVQHTALDSAREGFVQALHDNGYEDVTFDVQNAQADASNLATIADRFVSNRVDLILAIATPAAQAMAGVTEEIPILGTAITDYETAKLVESNEQPGYNVSGTSDMNPVADQIDLLLRLKPDTKTVGLLYTSSEDNSILQAALAKARIEELGLRWEEVTVTNGNDVLQACQSLAGNCDAIYIPTDNVLASAMPIVCGVTEETKTPVICGESAQVLNGGLATLGLNYYSLGYQTGLMAIRVLEGENISTMPIENSTEFDYVINKTVADAIGIAIPDDLLEYVITVE